jgi:hypothetical protein
MEKDDGSLCLFGGTILASAWRVVKNHNKTVRKTRNPVAITVLYKSNVTIKIKPLLLLNVVYLE